MGVNSLPKTVTRQRRDCDLNPDPSAPESSTLITRLPSHPIFWIATHNTCCRIEKVQKPSLGVVGSSTVVSVNPAVNWVEWLYCNLGSSSACLCVPTRSCTTADGLHDTLYTRKLVNCCTTVKTICSLQHIHNKSNLEGKYSLLYWEYRSPRKRNSRPSSTPTILNAHSPQHAFL